jgi:hypothetical protein
MHRCKSVSFLCRPATGGAACSTNLFLFLLLLPPGAPVLLNTTLKFCASPSRNSRGCCDATADAALSKQFDAMAISDAACAAVVKSILCAVSHPCLVLFCSTPDELAAFYKESTEATLRHCKLCSFLAVANSLPTCSTLGLRWSHLIHPALFDTAAASVRGCLVRGTKD